MSGLAISILKVAKMPQGDTTLLGVKITQHHQITQSANFQQNPTTFKKSLSKGGFFNIFGVKNATQGGAN